jgi:cell division transport system ATP-binding protein
LAKRGVEHCGLDAWTAARRLCQGRARRKLGGPGAGDVSESAVVRLENIGKRYGTDADILHDVSLTLDAGGFYFLTGVSGAGKTTLLKIIYLAEPPTRGAINLFDTDVAAADRATRNALHRRIGIVFQDFRLVEHLTVRDNVALPLRIAGAPEREIRENVPELLGWMGLEGRLDYRPAQLSGGEQQRVAIARAIVRRPDLLIADEPTGNIDDEIAMLLVRVFERINKLGTTVLIATHDVAFARQFAHRRYHLDRGVLSVPDEIGAEEEERAAPERDPVE